MGGKAILILVLVAGALGLVLALTNKEAPIEEKGETSVLDGRSLGNAVRIRWQFDGEEAVEIGRAADGRFAIQEPIVDIASGAYLKQIVHSWDSAQMREVPWPDDEASRQKAGLEPPQLMLIAEWSDGKRIEVGVGANGTLGDTRFLYREGKIWEGGQALLGSMRVGLDDLRERTVFRHAFRTATELRVEQQLPSGKRETLHLKQQGKQGQEWHLLEPVTGRADPVAAQRFVTAVSSLAVSHFVSSVVRAPGRPPEITIEIQGAYGTERTELWFEDGQVWGRIPGRDVYFICDNREYVQVFVNAANNLRARILVPMGESTFEDLVELVVDPGQGRGKRIRLMRESQTNPWLMLEPIEYKTNITAVNEAAHALHRLVAREFVSDEGSVRPRANDPRYGMVGKRWAVTTRKVHTKDMHTLWFGSELMLNGEEMVYCCRSDEPDNVAIVPRQPFTVLQRAFTDYCDREVLRQTARAHRLELSHRDGRKRVYLVVDGEWRLEGVEGSRDEVGDLADDLRELGGKRVVDMGEKSGFGEADWELVMMRGNQDTLGLIRFWDRGEGELLVAKNFGLRPDQESQPVGVEISARNSRDLRALWK